MKGFISIVLIGLILWAIRTKKYQIKRRIQLFYLILISIDAFVHISKFGFTKDVGGMIGKFFLIVIVAYFLNKIKNPTPQAFSIDAIRSKNPNGSNRQNFAKTLNRILIVLLYLCIVSCTSKKEVISPKPLSTLNVKHVFNDGFYNSQKISKSVFPVTLKIQGSQIEVTTNTSNKYKGTIGSLEYTNIKGYGHVYHFTWYNTTILSAFNSSSDSYDVHVSYVTGIDNSVSIMFERGHGLSFHKP